MESLVQSIQIHQQFFQEDYYRLMNFCKWILVWWWQSFFDCVFFNESTFHYNILVYRHNFNHSIDEYASIFDGYSSANMSLSFIRDHLPIPLETTPHNIHQRVWMQQDGAPAHFQGRVRICIYNNKEHFENLLKYNN